MKIALALCAEMCLLSPACGRCEDTTILVESEPSLTEVAQEIVGLCGDTLSDQIASIGFDEGSLVYPTVGQCSMPVIATHERDRTIKVSRSFWRSHDAADRWFLLEHEILHCQFNISHDDTILMGEKVPFGVMDLDVVQELYVRRVCPERMK